MIPFDRPLLASTAPLLAAATAILLLLAVGNLFQSCRLDDHAARLDALEAVPAPVPCSAPSRGPVGVLPEGS